MHVIFFCDSTHDKCVVVYIHFPYFSEQYVMDQQHQQQQQQQQHLSDFKHDWCLSKDPSHINYTENDRSIAWEIFNQLVNCEYLKSAEDSLRTTLHLDAPDQEVLVIGAQIVSWMLATFREEIDIKHGFTQTTDDTHNSVTRAALDSNIEEIFKQKNWPPVYPRDESPIKKIATAITYALKLKEIISNPSQRIQYRIRAAFEYLYCYESIYHVPESFPTFRTFSLGHLNRDPFWEHARIRRDVAIALDGCGAVGKSSAYANAVQLDSFHDFEHLDVDFTHYLASASCKESLHYLEKHHSAGCALSYSLRLTGDLLKTCFDSTNPVICDRGPLSDAAYNYMLEWVKHDNDIMTNQAVFMKDFETDLRVVDKFLTANKMEAMIFGKKGFDARKPWCVNNATVAVYSSGTNSEAFEERNSVLDQHFKKLYGSTEAWLKIQDLAFEVVCKVFHNDVDGGDDDHTTLETNMRQIILTDEPSLIMDCDMETKKCLVDVIEKQATRSPYCVRLNADLFSVKKDKTTTMTEFFKEMDVILKLLSTHDFYVDFQAYIFLLLNGVDGKLKFSPNERIPNLYDRLDFFKTCLDMAVFINNCLRRSFNNRKNIINDDDFKIFLKDDIKNVEPMLVQNFYPWLTNQEMDTMYVVEEFFAEKLARDHNRRVYLKMSNDSAADIFNFEKNQKYVSEELVTTTLEWRKQCFKFLSQAMLNRLRSYDDQVLFKQLADYVKELNNSDDTTGKATAKFDHQLLQTMNTSRSCSHIIARIGSIALQNDFIKQAQQLWNFPNAGPLSIVMEPTCVSAIVIALQRIHQECMSRITIVNEMLNQPIQENEIRLMWVASPAMEMSISLSPLDMMNYLYFNTSIFTAKPMFDMVQLTRFQKGSKFTLEENLFNSFDGWLYTWVAVICSVQNAQPSKNNVSQPGTPALIHRIYEAYESGLRFRHGSSSDYVNPNNIDPAAAVNTQDVITKVCSHSLVDDENDSQYFSEMMSLFLSRILSRFLRQPKKSNYRYTYLDVMHKLVNALLGGTYSPMSYISHDEVRNYIFFPSPLSSLHVHTLNFSFFSKCRVRKSSQIFHTIDDINNKIVISVTCKHFFSLPSLHNLMIMCKNKTQYFMKIIFI